MINAIEIVKGIPDRSIDLTKWNGFAIQAERTAQAIQITCDEENVMATDALSEIKTFQKEVEAFRKSEVDPFNKLVKRINDIVRPIGESLDNAEKTIKDKARFYALEKERVRQEEERKRQAEYQAKLEEERKKAIAEKREQVIVTPPPTIMAAPPTTRGEIGASTIKKFWNYELLDIDVLYKTRPDLVKIEEKRREILVAIKINQNISGLRVFEDIDVSAR